MKPMIKMMLVMAAIFASTFIVAKATGFLSLDAIRAFLTSLEDASPLLVGGIVAMLLLSDLLIAVPTLGLCMLAGYLLGFYHGVFFCSVGILATGITGYWLSRTYGEKMLCLVLKREQEREETVATFEDHGFTVILLSRAMPMLPEISACLAGMTRMRFSRFICAWLLSTIPYVCIANYAGAISSIDNIKPLIFTAIGLPACLWLSWFYFSKKLKAKTANGLSRVENM